MRCSIIEAITISPWSTSLTRGGGGYWAYSKRNVKSLLRFFWELGAQKSSQILYVCSDRPYLSAHPRSLPLGSQPEQGPQ